jgi:hypothetical protein
MCYYITIAVRGSRAALLRESVPRGLTLSAAENRSIARHLPDEYRSFELTAAMCACDLYHRGSAGQPRSARKRLRKKYVKRGWSESKIERALAEATSRAVRPEFAGLRPDVAEWLAATARESGPLAVIVHWYTGRTDRETVPIAGEQHVAAADLDQGVAAVDEDVVVWVACN